MKKFKVGDYIKISMPPNTDRSYDGIKLLVVGIEDGYRCKTLNNKKYFKGFVTTWYGKFLEEYGDLDKKKSLINRFYKGF